LVSVTETNQPIDKTTALQTKLHQAAVRDAQRRFHALYDKISLPYVLRTALEMVKRNNGAPGIDGFTIESLAEYGEERFIEETAQQLRDKTYRPEPVRRVNIPKNGDESKLRPLGIPTIRDRTVQAAAKLILEPIFEADFEGSSFGFRPGIGQLQALEAIEKNARDGFRYVVDADIEQFFDTLDHQDLMAALRRRISDGQMLRLIYFWLKAGYVLDGDLHDTDQGSPQGGVLSPLLANAYLHAFDRAHKTQKSFISRLTRYADDFVIQCGTREQAEKALAWAAEQLSKLKLRLHPEKTRIVDDREEGFDFLGFYHRRARIRHGPGAGKERQGVIRCPSAKTCARFRDKVRARLGPPGRLRPVWKEITESYERFLRGWWGYYRHGHSSRVFRKLDDFARERLARNLARSQPKGEKRAKRKWTFYVAHKDMKQLATLAAFSKNDVRRYKGQAKAGWRAV
jgi:group II intron reverse transcriptase/maturase